MDRVGMELCYTVDQQLLPVGRFRRMDDQVNWCACPDEITSMVATGWII